MLTIISFLVAIGLLIAVHEYGHYKAARLCGVRVLRFSVGFGRPLLRWERRQADGYDTEFVVAAFPLGGYVRMLDEREAPVPADQRHLAFNTQPLRSRALIVAAGPVANLLLAVLLYAMVNWIGVQEPRAVLASPPDQSIAQRAGLEGGDRVLKAGFSGEELESIVSFDALRWLVTRGALEKKDLTLQVSDRQNGRTREVRLPLSDMGEVEADARLLRQIGFIGPWTRPTIGDVLSGSPADLAGLKAGDLVLRVDGKPVSDGQQLRQLIRGAVKGDRAFAMRWDIRRDDREMTLSISPELKREGVITIGRIGAFVGSAPEMVTVHLGPIDGLWRGLARTAEISALTLRMMGKMLVGEASLKNLSGPLTIADYAGKSASMGLTQYLAFLALVSVSLGILNLLPLPVLDGGHLMYYLWEGITGSSVSDLWMERLQRGGVALLFAMMSIALFNDISRFLG